LIVVLLGVPAAHVLARHARRIKEDAQFFALSPRFTPPVAIALPAITIFQRAPQRLGDPAKLCYRCFSLASCSDSSTVFWRKSEPAQLQLIPVTHQRSIMAQDLFYTEGDCGDLVLGRHMSRGADDQAE